MARDKIRPDGARHLRSIPFKNRCLSFYSSFAPIAASAAWPTRHYADLRCRAAAGFFAAVSFACFLPEIGISISF